MNTAPRVQTAPRTSLSSALERLGGEDRVAGPVGDVASRIAVCPKAEAR